jgi:hypothetical protein
MINLEKWCKIEQWMIEEVLKAEFNKNYWGE